MINLFNGRLLASALMLLLTTSAYSANVLYVDDDDGSDNNNIITALQADGHTVTTVLNDYVDDLTEDNTLLQGNLSAYSIIIWAASTDGGSGDQHALATTSNLAAWVTNGGWLFVTGYDTVASPTDPNLITLIGAGVNSDDDDALGSITLANELTTGVINLVGVTPAAFSDQDSVPIADLVAGTVCVSGDGVDCSWTLRTLGTGRIAYVSTDSDNEWLEPPLTTDDAYAYNAALRNFVFNAPQSLNPTAVPTLSIWGLGLMVSLFGLFGVAKRKRLI